MEAYRGHQLFYTCTTYWGKVEDECAKFRVVSKDQVKLTAVGLNLTRRIGAGKPTITSFDSIAFSKAPPVLDNAIRIHQSSWR
jgi:hypothetical protein